MKTKLLAIGLLSSTLLASIAVAQGQPPAPPAGNAQPPIGSTDARPADSRFITQEGSQGVLRLTDVIGQNAVGTDNKTIGEIEDVVLDHDGKVAAYIVKVSGTPGIGSRAVAVPVRAVEIDPVGMTATTGTIQSEGIACEHGRRTEGEKRDADQPRSHARQDHCDDPRGSAQVSSGLRQEETLTG
jgi:sporulation protein YlmC with PRC-barrel domain